MTPKQWTLIGVLGFVAFFLVIWLSGAILLLKRIHAGYYFMSALFVGMILGELAHFVFPFMEDGLPLRVGHVHRSASTPSRRLRTIYHPSGNPKCQLACAQIG